jgi:hypothetical protein
LAEQVAKPFRRNDVMKITATFSTRCPILLNA